MANHNGTSDLIYRRIREDILTGHFKPGERVVESRLAERYCVSRTPIREALARLNADHLVISAPKRGLVVSRLGSAELIERYAIRQLLEGYAAALAAQNITAEELRNLRSIVADMREAATPAAAAQRIEDREEAIHRLSALNNQFHAGIQRAGRNGLLEEITRSVVDVPLVQQSFSLYSDADTAASIDEHAEAIEAIERGESAEAEAIIRKHIHRGLNAILLGLQMGRV